MRKQSRHHWLRHSWLALTLAAWPAMSTAQVAVADIEEVEELPTISSAELQELVGPIALYPDDLLAVVLPASTFPLQVIEAARFLEDLETDPSLKPDPDWDDSVVALINYPEVLELLNEDLDWTWRLGEAVVAQQADVIAAIELFRDRAYAAGNLKSDDYQIVAHDDGAIQITPVEEDVIHVPYYEPESVVVYQPRPVYYYYPRPYPVYYYPYPTHHVFYNNFFWGVTTAYTIGWHSHHLNVFHHSFYGHPYYGHRYWNRWWYRRPDIHVHNNYYVGNRRNWHYDRYRFGDRWRPNLRRTVRASDQRVTRTRYYPNPEATANARSVRSTGAFAGGSAQRQSSQHAATRRGANRGERADTPRSEIRFRDRPETPASFATNGTATRTTNVRRVNRDGEPFEPRAVTPQRRSTATPDSRGRQQQLRQTQPRQPQHRATRERRSEPRERNFRPSQPQPKTQVRSSPPREQQARNSQSRSSRMKSSAHRQSPSNQYKQASKPSRKAERASRHSGSRDSRRSRQEH